MKIGCLGPIGSYSCLAAKKLDPDAEVVTYKNFPAVVAALKTGEVDEIALPVENTLQGGVLQNMDLLASESELFAVKEYILPIRHRLVYRKGEKLEDVKRVYSHPQAIGQCSVFLSEKLSGAQTNATDSTSAALGMVQSAGDAAIVGEQMCENLQDLEVYPEYVADEKKNYTYFELVKKGKEHLNKPSEKIYFVATLPDKPGALFSLLSIINEYGWNMNKIESRPIKDKPGEYRFFIEVNADYALPKIQEGLSKIADVCGSLKLLGCY